MLDPGLGAVRMRHLADQCLDRPVAGAGTGALVEWVLDREVRRQRLTFDALTEHVAGGADVRRHRIDHRSSAQRLHISLVGLLAALWTQNVVEDRTELLMHAAIPSGRHRASPLD